MVVDDEYDGGGLVGSFNGEADGSTTSRLCVRNALQAAKAF